MPRFDEPHLSASPSRQPVLWFEIEDLLQFLASGQRPSGIPRVCIELVEAAIRNPGLGIRFCRLSTVTHRLVPMEAEAVAALSPSGVSRLDRLSGFISAAREHLTRRRNDRAMAARITRGDMIVTLGSTWPYRHYVAALDRAKKRYGLRSALFIHDVIAAVHPDLVHPAVGPRFNDNLVRNLRSTDVVIVSSANTEHDVAQFCRNSGIAAPPIVRIRFGSGFRVAFSAANDKPKPLPARYVLYVSTIEARKNHALLVEVWRQLLARHPPDDVPHLVLAGRIGWRVDDLVASLSHDSLHDKITIMSDLSDAGLAEAYRGCLLTVYPSLYEGWGLPVEESFRYGKLCVVANNSSLPEVGSDFADYFETHDVASAVAAIEGAMIDPVYLASREKHIADHFRSTGWDSTARQLADGLRNAVVPREPG